MERQIEALKKNSIIFAQVSDPLADPKIKSLSDYPNYSAVIKTPLTLRGMDEAEVRVLEVDENKKEICVVFHASSILNTQVSTGRAIMLTYISMQNTVYQVFRKLLP